MVERAFHLIVMNLSVKVFEDRCISIVVICLNHDSVTLLGYHCHCSYIATNFIRATTPISATNCY